MNYYYYKTSVENNVKSSMVYMVYGITTNARLGQKKLILWSFY